MEDVDLAGVGELRDSGQPASTAPAAIVRQDKVNRAFADLEADFKRQGGSLNQSQFDRLVLRRNLSPAEMLALLTRLSVAGIAPEESKTPLPAEVSSRPLPRDSNVRAVQSSDRQPRRNPYALLSHEEEVDLGRRIQLALRVQPELDPKKVATDQEKAVVLRGKTARDRMMLANLRLIRFAIANVRRPVRSLDSWDMFQEGTVGLMRAVEKFDPELGLRFSTYALWWIRQSIFRGLDGQDSTIRLPVHRMESIRRLRAMSRRLAVEYGHDPTLRDLAEALNWPLEKTVFVQRLAQLDCVSIDAPMGDDERRVGDRLAADEPSPFDNAQTVQRRDVLLRLLDSLSSRQKLVIERRFGLGASTGETLQQVGDDLGVTRERIRQIEEKALARLKKWIDHRLYDALK
jgi:RNA polymerase primary sigma factor